MKTKTLGLLTVLASLLVSGCNLGNDSSSTSNKPGNSSSNTPVDTTFGEGYISVLTAPKVDVRGIPTDILPNAKIERTYRSAFSTDPNTFDYLSNNKQTNSEYYANFIDNLLEHDQYGKIRGALAIACAYNEDFTSLRFKIRDDVPWVDYTGQVYTKNNKPVMVTADDFEAGLQHLLDAKGGAETLAYYIEGARDYADKKEKNFKNVGFYKHNDYEFEYFLAQPTPFFHTFFEYTSFLPLNRAFFKNMGGAFGVDEWNEAKKNCDFGLTTNPEYLLYCGPYILTEYKKQASLSMKKNPHYWDVENLQLDVIDYVYNSGTNVQTLVQMFKDNDLSSLGVNSTNRKELAEAFGEDAIFEQGTGTTTYYFNWNLNRQTYKVGSSVSPKLDNPTVQENTRKAILNENFRKAVFSAIPKIEMNAQSNDLESAEVCIRNTYTTPEFVSIDEEVTTSTGVRHKANSQYFEMVNMEMKKLNEVNKDDYAKYKSSYNKVSGTESNSEEESTFNDREDSYYNTDTARLLANKAKKELTKEGVTFPVQIDYLVYQDSSVMVSQAEILKDRVNKTIGDLVNINIQLAGLSDYENSHLMAATGADMNFDLSSSMGWGPDYGDPATFLSTFTWQGDLYNNLGFDNKTEDKAIYDKVLGDYQALYDQTYNSDCLEDGVYNTNSRYASFAAAEAELLNSAVIMPNTTDGGEAISRVVPKTNQRSFYGTDDSRFKYMVLIDGVITKQQRDAIIADWESKSALIEEK